MRQVVCFCPYAVSSTAMLGLLPFVQIFKEVDNSTTFLGFDAQGRNQLEMDPLFLAYSYFRRRKYQECVDLCSQLLEKNPYDQVTCCQVINITKFIN